MNLTEKGRIAFDLAIQYCKENVFSAAELSNKSGVKISAATLNGIVSRGYMEKIAGSPVKFRFVDDIDELITADKENEKGCDNTNLRKAKNIKNDEFYTQLDDIAKEVKNYKKRFSGKSVFCNCNDKPSNNFFKYFLTQFDVIGLTKLVAIEYVEGGHGIKYTIENDLNGDGIIDESDIVVEELNGDGGFGTDESIEELKKCDIVCTNPPFSVFREFIALLMKYGKKFLVIGSKNAITYKEFFPLLKENKVWIGTGNVQNFMQPDGTIKKFGNIGWFTNIPHTKRSEPLLLTSTFYDEKNRREEYPKYDNYDAIEVSKVVNIPKDYYGVMGVPVTFLDKYCPEQFEIIGGFNGYKECDYENGLICGNITDYYDNKSDKIKSWTGPTVNKKTKYYRILIKRK